MSYKKERIKVNEKSVISFYFNDFFVKYNWGNMTVLVDETGKPMIWKGE